MKTEYMREFIALSECLNYTEAARRLYVSQSALSKHISEMERELGQTLVLRTSHDVSLSPAGEVAVDGFRHVLSEYDKMAESVYRYASGITGSASIGFLYYALPLYAFPLMEAMNQNYPNIQVKVISGQPDQLAQMMRDGNADMAQVYSCDCADGIFGNGDLGSVKLGAEDIVVLVDRSDPLAQRTSLCWNDLSGRDYIAGFTSYDQPDYARMILEKHDVSLGKPVMLDQIDLVPFGLKGTDRVMVGMSALESVWSPEIACVPIEGGQGGFTSCLVYRKDNENPCLPIIVDAQARIADAQEL